MPSQQVAEQWMYDTRGSVRVKFPDELRVAFTDECFVVRAVGGEDDGRTIAVCPGDDEQAAANAGLIAAAREMFEGHLASVENITKALELGDRGDWANAEIFLNNQRGISEAAIAKATGDAS